MIILEFIGILFLLIAGATLLALGIVSLIKCLIFLSVLDGFGLKSMIWTSILYIVIGLFMIWCGLDLMFAHFGIHLK